tara:strand:- start:1421 stop:2035 length:615 start_codon:yes stop_codon:yes gene_type:complete
MSNKGMDYEKYNKIYLKKGVMTKSGGFVGKYGDNKDLDSKWDRYGNAFDGKESIDDIMQLKPTSMLDIGCGHNQFIKKIKQIKDIRAVGIDIACPSADFIAPAHILPFKDQSFDMIVSFDCMEHIPEEEVDLSFKEFSRVANRIYLKISLAHSKTLIDNEPVHVCVKPKEWWVEISRKYFQDTKVLLHNRKNTLWENIVLYGRK